MDHEQIVNLVITDVQNELQHKMIITYFNYT